MSTDDLRTVHASISKAGEETIWVVRYDRSGHWYREQGMNRKRITLLEAVKLAAEPIDSSDTSRSVKQGGYGGSRFTKQVRMTEALLRAGVTPGWMA